MGKNIHEKTRGKTSSHRTSFKMYPCREQNRAVQHTQYSQLTLDIRIFLIKTFKRRSRILWMEWEICKCVCIWLNAINANEMAKEWVGVFGVRCECCAQETSTPPPLDSEDNFSFPRFFYGFFPIRVRKVKMARLNTKASLHEFDSERPNFERDKKNREKVWGRAKRGQERKRWVDLNSFVHSAGDDGTLVRNRISALKIIAPHCQMTKIGTETSATCP